MGSRNQNGVTGWTAGVLALLVLAGCEAGRSLPEHVEQQVQQVPPRIEVPAEAAPENRMVGVIPASRLAMQMALARGPEQDSLEETIELALGRIGPAALPSILPLLSDPDPEMRIAAAEVIARIGPEAEGAVPALTALLADEDEDVRRAAARALGEIGPAAASAVPALLESLQGAHQDKEA